jgi:hypothetical protein
MKSVINLIKNQVNYHRQKSKQAPEPVSKVNEGKINTSPGSVNFYRGEACKVTEDILAAIMEHRRFHLEHSGEVPPYTLAKVQVEYLTRHFNVPDNATAFTLYGVPIQVN